MKAFVAAVLESIGKIGLTISMTMPVRLLATMVNEERKAPFKKRTAWNYLMLLSRSHCDEHIMLSCRWVGSVDTKAAAAAAASAAVQI
jgi:hypothetical protein